MNVAHSFSVSPLLMDIVRFNYSTIPPEEHHLVPAHLHHYHQLDVVLEGEVTVALECQKPCPGRRGDAWLIPPLVWHQIESTTGFRQISFKFLMTPRFWVLFGAQFRQFKVPPHILEYLEQTGIRCTEKASLTDQRAVAALSLCLIEFLDQNPSAPSGPDHLDEFRHALWPLLESIQNDPYRQWTVSRMAAQCYLSTDHFSRCFHQILDQTPQRYLRDARMRASAAELLIVPERAIKDIAERAGYSTVAAFSRAFKEVFKVSPAAYRHTFR